MLVGVGELDLHRVLDVAVDKFLFEGSVLNRVEDSFIAPKVDVVPEVLRVVIIVTFIFLLE